jgi:pilus assembly protein Flp/PilA
MRCIRDFLLDDDGPTAVEYAVMLCLIIVACIGSVQALCTNTYNSFNTTSSQITTAISSGS